MATAIQSFYLNNNNQLLLKVLFNRDDGKDDSCNVSQLDDKPCVACKQVPPIKLIEKTNKQGKVFIIKDRSARVDVEDLNGDLGTYHVGCWIFTMDQYRNAHVATTQ